MRLKTRAPLFLFAFSAGVCFGAAGFYRLTGAWVAAALLATIGLGSLWISFLSFVWIHGRRAA